MDMPNLASSQAKQKPFAVVSNTLGVLNERQAARRLLELGQRLSRSLRLREVIENFFHALREETSFDSVEYHHEGLGLTLESGKPQRHRLDYHLSVEDESIGTLTLTRHRVFSAREIRLVEDMTSMLLLPLRNACLYKRALMSAYEDPLTGVLNRASLDRTLPKEIDRSLRHGQPLSLLVVDIDHFKSINDNHGHQAGDRVLRELADIMRDCIRSCDLLYRYGGDEFVIALPNTAQVGALEVAERIRRRIERGVFSHAGVRLVVSASIGVAEARERDAVETILQRADEAMFGSKRSGRNRVVAT